MSKIYIVGSVASEKTTLAKQLSSYLNIRWYELDAIVYDDSHVGRPKRTIDEQHAIIKSIDQSGGWIMEGVHRESYRQLYELADVIIFIHPSVAVRRYRIVLRFIRQKLKVEKVLYKPTFSMLRMMFKWTNEFDGRLNEFENILEPYNHKVVRMKHMKEEYLWSHVVSS